MKKYQKLLIARCKQTLLEWEQKEKIDGKEFYRFFHSLKGTAASIELHELATIADHVLEEINTLEKDEWYPDEWKCYTAPLGQLLGKEEQETILPIEPIKYQKKDEQNKLVLIVDDDIDMVTFLKTNLEQQGYMVLAALTAKKAIQVFYNQKPDCVLLDVNLPDKNGFDVLKKMLEKSHSLFIPVFMMSTDNSKETVVKSFQMGAVDFVAKPIFIEEIVARLENRLKYKEMISEAVLIDELTGAFNRKFFSIEVERQLYEFKRSKDPFSIVLIDLDHFKQVNDLYGHDIGDIVLREFSNYVKKAKRHSDFFIRYGGEEFVLILPRTTKEDSKIFIERLLKGFSKIEFPTNENKTFTSTFSSGIVEVNDENTDIDTYMKHADQALYEAKAAGRKAVVIYNSKETYQIQKKVLRIGIIDDDTIVHQIVSEQLEKLKIGHYAIEISSFREGEAFFESKWHTQPGKNLVILDGIMPRMDGLEVLQKLRKHPNGKNAMVLMLTGRKSEKDIVKALELGADDYLTKPFSLPELIARVKRLTIRMITE
ncbi:response regulator [Alkalihalobacillus sp. LMS39]|uniref:GGDEF domain-containing response regulator n=1 Tax=Alkalihalobacillus sp. LMS39 TaxID=2924032 RepID=UPI001FB3A32E|nr:response regulator [Alkalihalobacillus sp. LMS39]UOE93116.1 response regulator [Alkalihalobacillus sp. LMS39]